MGGSQIHDWVNIRVLWFPAKILEVLLPNLALHHSLFILCLSNMAEEKTPDSILKLILMSYPKVYQILMIILRRIYNKILSWGLTDDEVAAEVAKLSEEDKKLYEQIKTFTDSFYRQHGYIIPITDLIQVTMTKRFPGIPTQTAEQQEELRQELLQEVRKRKALEEANVEEAPPCKIRHIQTNLLPKKIIA